MHEGDIDVKFLITIYVVCLFTDYPDFVSLRV